MKLLALSGSLRKHSYNTAALEAVAQVAPGGIEVNVFRSIGDLPLFNPDRESQRIPVVEHLKHALGRAQA